MIAADRSGQNRMLTALVIGEMASSYETGMIYSALGTMYRTFDDPVGVGWLITAFMLVSAAASAVCARLGDLYGRRPVLVAMLVLAAAGSLISAFSSSLTGVIAGRALQGASAAVLPLSIGLIREHLPAARVPVGVSYLTAMAAFGAGLGLFTAGIIVDHYSWQLMFHVSAAQALLALVLVLIFVPASQAAARQGGVDILGGVLFVPALAGLLLVVSNGRNWGWGDGRTLGLFAASLALMGFWILYELRHRNPLIDVRQFARRKIALTNLDMALFGLGPSQVMLILMLLLQQPAWTGVGLGISATLAALVKLPGNVLALVFGPLGGQITAKHGGRQAMLLAVAVVLAAWIGMTAWHDSLWFLAAMILAASAGGSMMYAAMPNLIVEAAPQERTSEMTGLANVVRATFTAIGAQLVTFVLASSTITDPDRGPGVYPAAEAYLFAFAAVVASLLLMFVTTWLLPGRSPAAVPARAAGLVGDTTR
jgi:MFS family permease